MRLYNLISRNSENYPVFGRKSRRLLARTPDNHIFAKAVVDGIKRLAIVQNDNPWVTNLFTVTAGIWIHYRGVRSWLINPAQSFLPVETHHAAAELPDLGKTLKPGIVPGSVVKTDKAEFQQWRDFEPGLPLLWKFFENLPPTKTVTPEGDVRHVRYISGEVCELAAAV